MARIKLTLWQEIRWWTNFLFNPAIIFMHAKHGICWLRTRHEYKWINIPASGVYSEECQICGKWKIEEISNE